MKDLFLPLKVSATGLEAQKSDSMLLLQIFQTLTPQEHLKAVPIEERMLSLSHTCMTRFPMVLMFTK